MVSTIVPSRSMMAASIFVWFTGIEIETNISFREAPN